MMWRMLFFSFMQSLSLQLWYERRAKPSPSFITMCRCFCCLCVCACPLQDQPWARHDVHHGDAQPRSRVLRRPHSVRRGRHVQEAGNQFAADAAWLWGVHGTHRWLTQPDIYAEVHQLSATKLSIWPLKQDLLCYVDLCSAQFGFLCVYVLVRFLSCLVSTIVLSCRF